MATRAAGCQGAGGRNRAKLPLGEIPYNLDGQFWEMAKSRKAKECPDRRGIMCGVRSRRTAATFIGRSSRSGGRCQFGGICARVKGFHDPSGVYPKSAEQLARDGRQVTTG